MEQRSAEWFSARKGRVTGSAVGAILGLNPYMTADDVLRRMVREYHGAESEFTGNAATEYGTFHEAGAVFEYQLETGQSVTECGFFADEDWLGASPDGLVGVMGLIEIKCPFSQRDKVPPELKTAAEQPHYYAQMQIEMLCADREWCDFFQWSPNGTKLETVTRDESWIATHLPELKAFHARYLSELGNKAHLEPRRRELYGPKASALLEQYDDLTDAIESATERRKEVLAELVKLAGEQNATINGRNLTMVEREGSVSYAKAIKELCPGADLEPYRGKPTSYWMLR
jgi:putative phage-type endonuclease